MKEENMRLISRYEIISGSLVFFEVISSISDPVLLLLPFRDRSLGLGFLSFPIPDPLDYFFSSPSRIVPLDPGLFPFRF